MWKLACCTQWGLESFAPPSPLLFTPILNFHVLPGHFWWRKRNYKRYRAPFSPPCLLSASKGHWIPFPILYHSSIIRIYPYFQFPKEKKYFGLVIEFCVRIKSPFISSSLPFPSQDLKDRAEGSGSRFLVLEHHRASRHAHSHLLCTLTAIKPWPGTMHWWGLFPAWPLECCQSLWAQPPRWKNLGSYP